MSPDLGVVSDLLYSGFRVDIFVMSTWRSAIGAKTTKNVPADDDDWETDPDFVVCSNNMPLYGYILKW